jgi:Uncharacterized conserved protein
MNQPTISLTVRNEITVEASQERAFEVFTAEIGTWWPLADKTIGDAEAEIAIIEPRAGGRWYERGVDGSECEWGTVIAYEPSDRLVLDWQISAGWAYDPELHTEIEVRFIAETEERTRVELEHRGLEAYGGDAEQMRQIFASPDGWSGILADYGKAS